ncbi:MAG: sigma-70 family RNA polymerase sigma factor [Phycisphaera sp.]|nr:sigma-70 family RNA polymerase sigma factor [Phycisphaera sp.]
MSNTDHKRIDLTVRWTQAQPNVAAFIRSIVRNPTDAEDILQDTAYRIAVKFDDYDAARPFIAWCIGIARNCVLEWRRKHARDAALLDAEAIEHIAAGYEQRAPEHSRMSVTLQRCLDKLTDNGRRLLELRYDRNLKPARIAEMLDSTPASISATLYRVREMLRQCVESTHAAEREATP